MNCPRCTTPVLEEREREGMTVDICPTCRGVWLDRGELEKLIARAARELEEVERLDGRDRAPRSYREHDDHDEYRYERFRDGRPYPRKRRWLDALGDIFD